MKLSLVDITTPVVLLLVVTRISPVTFSPEAVSHPRNWRLAEPVAVHLKIGWPLILLARVSLMTAAIEKDKMWVTVQVS